jgi:hypothetical protein
VSFDKFDWLKAVYADPRFPAGEKALLAYVTVFSVQYGKYSFRVRQSTLADPEHSGISRQTVGSAIRRAKRHGYLAVVSPHAPGRTHHTAEALQLLLPAKSKASLHDSAKMPVGVALQAAKSKEALHDSDDAESCKANGGNGVKQTVESCKAANSPTSENDTPNSSLNGSIKGSGPENPTATTQGQEPRIAPNGASLDKKQRPQLGGRVHVVIRSTNIDRAGNPPSPKQNDALRESRKRHEERLAGISGCDACDDVHGYLPDNTKCWHGKEPEA